MKNRYYVAIMKDGTPLCYARITKKDALVLMAEGWDGGKPVRDGDTNHYYLYKQD